MEKKSFKCLLLVLMAFLLLSFYWRQEGNEYFVEERYLEKVVLYNALEDPVDMDIAPDGKIYIVERKGNIKAYNTNNDSVIVVGKLEVHNIISGGLFGLALDPNFTENQRIYVQYTPLQDTTIQYVSQFKLENGKLDYGSEQYLLEIPVEFYNHLGGGLAFDNEGNLFVATGDNSKGDLPVDEREGRSLFDAQRTAANSNSLRGKILRITPRADGTYSIPSGNLFAKNDPESRAEIYIMGCRNPFRIYYDKKTNYLYWGDVGPNSAEDSERGPKGYEEVNGTNNPGNFGWPHFNADNKPLARIEAKKGKPGEFFDPKKPLNNSPNNTGKKELPPAQSALIWYPGEESEQWPVLGKGTRSIKAGPVYHYKEYYSSTRLPEHFNNVLFIYEWSRNWIMAVHLDGPEGFSKIEPFMPKSEFASPIDMQFGLDGALFVLEYGEKFYNNRDGKLVKIEYRKGEASPIDNTATNSNEDNLLRETNNISRGQQLVNDNDCNTCHQLKEDSFGPSYQSIAKRYRSAPLSDIKFLSQKIISGGSGNWGEVAMNPHPYLTQEEVGLMLDYILSLKKSDFEQEKK